MEKSKFSEFWFLQLCLCNYITTIRCSLSPQVVLTKIFEIHNSALLFCLLLINEELIMFNRCCRTGVGTGTDGIVE